MIVFLLLVSLTLLAVYVWLSPSRHLVFAGVISDLPEGVQIVSKSSKPRIFVTHDGKKFSTKKRFHGLAYGLSMDAYGIPDGAEFFGEYVSTDLSRSERVALLKDKKDPIVVIEPSPTEEFPAGPTQTAKRLRCISAINDDGEVFFHPYFDGREHTTRTVDDVICVVDGVAK